MLHWTGQKSFSLREALSQDVVLDAIRYDLVQERLQQARFDNRDRLRTIVRPGVAREPGEDQHERIRRCGSDRCAKPASGSFRPWP